MKKCISCGSKMIDEKDYMLGDESKEYCIYCSREDGSMLSYEEKLASLTNLIVRTQGLDKDVANKAAKSILNKFPAWKEEIER